MVKYLIENNLIILIYVVGTNLLFRPIKMFGQIFAFKV